MSHSLIYERDEKYLVAMLANMAVLVASSLNMRKWRLYTSIAKMYINHRFFFMAKFNQFEQSHCVECSEECGVDIYDEMGKLTASLRQSIQMQKDAGFISGFMISLQEDIEADFSDKLTDFLLSRQPGVKDSLAFISSKLASV